MSGQPQEKKHPHADKSERQIDQSIEDTFPASDAPATSGGTTRIERDGQEAREERGKHERPADKAGDKADHEADPKPGGPRHAG